MRLMNQIELHTHILTKKEGYIHIVTNPKWNGTFNLENAKVVIKAIIELSDNQLMPVYLKATNGKTDSDARNYMASQSEHVKKIAIFSTNVMVELMGNFFIGFNKPKVPIKLFKDEEKAIEWLLEN